MSLGKYKWIIIYATMVFYVLLVGFMLIYQSIFHLHWIVMCCEVCVRILFKSYTAMTDISHLVVSHAHEAPSLAKHEKKFENLQLVEKLKTAWLR